MSSALEERFADFPTIDDRLDELIPRPAPMWRRTLGGTLIIVLAATGSLLWSFGYIVPMQSIQNSSSSARFTVTTFEGDPAILVTKVLWNPTKRDVRLVDLSLNGPGVELVHTSVQLRDPVDEAIYGNCTTTGDITTCTSLTPGADCTRTQSRSGDTTEVCTLEDQESFGHGFDPSAIPDDAAPLPVTIPAGFDADLYVVIRPRACTGPTEFPWGIIKPTFDFGDGAFPPFAHTSTSDDSFIDDPDWVPQLGASLGPNNSDPGTEDFLTHACRVLDRSD